MADTQVPQAEAETTARGPSVGEREIQVGNDVALEQGTQHPDLDGAEDAAPAEHEGGAHRGAQG